ncbi:MAG: DUF952 domain-containing protein [Proteobacteria bacterium]|nr:DUF952 domain-containing protein [Pseudomonadota bacterium]
MTMIYHMADEKDWRDAEASGAYLGTANDKADGFIHFSTAETVVESAAKHRAGEEGLVLIRVKAELLGEALKWEPARGGVLFPHLYGVLETAFVHREDALPLGPDGRHVFPELE